MDYANENTSIGTPIDFEPELGPVQLRPHAQLRAQHDLRVALGARQELDGRRHARQDRRRLAGERPSSSRNPGRRSTIAGNGTGLLNTPGNSCVCQSQRLEHGARRARPGQALFRPAVYSLPAAGVQGNMKRNSGPEGPGFWQLDMSLFKRFAVGGTRFAEFRVDAFNTTNSVRWGNPATGYSIAAGNTFGQITTAAEQLAATACASADGSFSRQLSAISCQL